VNALPLRGGRSQVNGGVIQRPTLTLGYLMPDDAREPKNTTETHATVDETPPALRSRGMGAWRLDVLLALVGLGLAVAFKVRRPVLAILVVAFFLVGHALVRLWQRYEEHPDRGRRVRRARPTRMES
jgi:hypothetical protein